MTQTLASIYKARGFSRTGMYELIAHTAAGISSDTVTVCTGTKAECKAAARAAGLTPHNY